MARRKLAFRDKILGPHAWFDDRDCGHCLDTIAGIETPKHLTLASPAPDALGVSYLAPRGGRDGNMIQLYTLATRPPLCRSIGLRSNSPAAVRRRDLELFPRFQRRSGSVSFGSAGSPSHPRLLMARPYTAAEWQATFSNWQLTGTESVKALQVAGSGSVRWKKTTACPSAQTGVSNPASIRNTTRKPPSLLDESVTVTYTCQFTHNLYLGTSLYGTSAPGSGVALA